MPGLFQTLRDALAGAKNYVAGEPLESWPELASAVATREVTEPDRMKGVKVQPLSGFERLLYKLGGNSIYAAYSPLTGKLKVDRENIERDKMTNDSSFMQTLLEHELTHADQAKRHGRIGSMLKTVQSAGQEYANRPLEREALDAEGNTWRKYKTHDIDLKR
jgi:hypothetical protein